MDVDLTDRNVRIGAVEAGDQITYPADETVTATVSVVSGGVTRSVTVTVTR
jgi:hypothetical protein